MAGPLDGKRKTPYFCLTVRLGVVRWERKLEKAIIGIISGGISIIWVRKKLSLVKRCWKTMFLPVPSARESL